MVGLLPRGLAGAGRVLAQQRCHVGIKSLGLPKRARLQMGMGIAGDFNEAALQEDWEYADGTPAPLTARSNYVERQLRAYTEMIIESCATIEEMAEKNQLPMRPGTDNIRKFDPKCELYLPVNDVIMDQTTSVAQKYEIYGDRAPYYSGDDHPTVQADETEGGHVAGDGSSLATSSAAAADVATERTQKKRRKKVVSIKQHYRHRQPYGNEHGPYIGSEKHRFVGGLGTAN